LLHREKALLHANLAVAAAGATGVGRGTRFGAATGTAGAVFQRRHSNLDRGAGYGVFQAQLEVVLQVGALAYARAPAATENIAENIAESIAETAAAEAAASRLVDTSVAELVVSGAFIGIGKYVRRKLPWLP
jgi:hypothetical protein